jgi:uncharacterized membrane protein YhhN
MVPILILHLFLNDHNIGKPVGKFIFFIGLILAFFGDVLQIIIRNDIFFIWSIVAFMLMNYCYGFSFFMLNRKGFKKPFLYFGTGLILFLFEFLFIQLFGNEMGDSKIPVIIYMVSLSVMILMAVNVAGNEKYRSIALRYLIPGAIIFMIENGIMTANLFHLGGRSELYVFSVLPYGIAQYLIVKGIRLAYL